MAVTSTRDITKLELLQQQPESTNNDAFDNFDKRDQILTLSGQTGGTVTLTKAQALCGIWLITGTLTSDLVVKFPATGYTRAPVVYNGTTGAYTVTVSPNSGGTGTVVMQGRRKLLYFDGTNVVDAITETGEPFISARVYSTSAQSIPNVTESALTFPLEDHDTAAMHSTVTNTSRLTVVVPGYYEVGACCQFALSAAGTYRAVYIKRFNSSGVLQETFAANTISSAVPYPIVQASAPTRVSCATSDYFEVHAGQDSGGSLNTHISGGTYFFAPIFWARWIG
jgi:hypothetical protein